LLLFRRPKVGARAKKPGIGGKGRRGKGKPKGGGSGGQGRRKRRLPSNAVLGKTVRLRMGFLIDGA